MNFSRIKNRALSYLKIKPSEAPSELCAKVDESLDMLCGIERFRCLYQEFDGVPDILQKEPYLSFLKDSCGCFISAYTLGSEVDRKIALLARTDASLMVVLDAVASSYLEERADEFEASLKDNLTYRFCPGYASGTLEDLDGFFRLLHCDKIGMCLLESGIMLPQKSMIGIIGKLK
jgi:hypothetical protein